jgi:hypothetical protein
MCGEMEMRLRSNSNLGSGLVFDIMGRTQAEDVREEGVEENIWTEER